MKFEEEELKELERDIKEERDREYIEDYSLEIEVDEDMLLDESKDRKLINRGLM